MHATSDGWDIQNNEIAGPSKADGLKSGSDFDGDKKGAQSDEIGLSEIEQLLKGKKFSRQVMRLVVV
ncbi:nuclear pore complex protein NUP1 [Prunus yedoensis var. nudiflora]|uniref:Nuclear pore complex protein NUP1 n=1 Tax=Prunus yedoensis var. nudiflora TaxID=2094558 RepID=A0A314XW09_PRUYE|nr:nuclear pore complex protein NUP1 [Prunus yedoensis var. nudiflora]